MLPRYARLAAQTLPYGSVAVLPGLYHLQRVLAHRPVVPTAHRIPPRALDVTAAAAGVTHNVRPQAINHASRPAH